MSLEFFQRTRQEIQHRDCLEPRAARGRDGLQGALTEAMVDVSFGQRLREKTGVDKTGTRVSAIHMESGTGYQASVFIDATYEGDLLAQAKVSYIGGARPWPSTASRWEACEPSPGSPVRCHRLAVRCRADSCCLSFSRGPKEMSEPPTRRSRRYNFRLCLTDVAANRLPIPKPAGSTRPATRFWLSLVAAETARSGNPADRFPSS